MAASFAVTSASPTGAPAAAPVRTGRAGGHPTASRPGGDARPTPCPPRPLSIARHDHLPLALPRRLSCHLTSTILPLQRDPSFHGGRDANHTRNGRAATPPGGGSNFWAVIPAGGSGTRLLAAERAGRPKFCCHCSDSNRAAANLCSTHPAHRPERILVVCGRPRRRHRRQLPELPTANIIVEPSPNGTGRRWRWRPR